RRLPPARARTRRRGQRAGGGSWRVSSRAASLHGGPATRSPFACRTPKAGRPGGLETGDVDQVDGSGMISRLERARDLAPIGSVPMRLAAMLAVGASTALLASPAGADGGLERLRQVFNEGRQLEEKDHWAEALDKFKEVATTKMTPQVRFHIALCEEKLGK